MKLLFDQNLSPRLVIQLADLYPDSKHVYPLALDRVRGKRGRIFTRESIN